MPERMTLDSIMQAVGATCPPVLLASIGGAVRLLRGNRRCSFRAVVAELATAAFTGMVVHLLLADLAFIPPTAKSACVALSGYSGGVLLNILAERVCDAAANIKPMK